MKLWTGRLSGKMDEWAVQLNHSLSYDQRMAFEDVKGSIAWARALFRAGILTAEEHAAIHAGLEWILAQIEAGEFQPDMNDEDIHTAVEHLLTERIGAVGGKLHTGRSRNDQVATDFRLWVIGAIDQVVGWTKSLQQTLIERSEEDMGIIICGYTHLQQAQPILLSHWWLSHFWSLQRDVSRLAHLREECRMMPLGAAALAGTGFSIDRFALAEDLGFSNPAPNSLDAVSDRDFALEFLFCASMIGMHLSRMAESMILYCTQEFGLLSLADIFSTGSSIMPQKKNPDPLELTRGKAGILSGKLMGLMATLKGLPSAYDKDLQEDKEPVFEAYDLLEVLLKVMNGVVQTLTVNEARAKEMIHPYMMATDLADHLVETGVPFREAHHLVAGVIGAAEDAQVALPDLPLSVWQSVSDLFGEWVYAYFDPTQSIQRHSAWGGTAPKAVGAQIAYAKSKLSA
ncbi:MAG: argininosuccinate lyase [Anaerolineaceae bacterium]|nr:argininosuccinate lyase [Anaerolineaceae bacterium]